VDAVTLILINVMSNSKYTDPPKLSGQSFIVVFRVRVKPVVVMILVVAGAPLVVLMGCSWAPWRSACLVSVSAVLIGMADIVSMFGTIVGYFKPFVSVTVPLHDPLIWGG